MTKEALEAEAKTLLAEDAELFKEEKRLEKEIRDMLNQKRELEAAIAEFQAEGGRVWGRRNEIGFRFKEIVLALARGDAA